MDHIPTLCSIIDSKIEAVDSAEESVRRLARDAGFPDEDVYFIGLAAREILINAVVHGNRFHPDKTITLQLFVEHGRFTIEIADEGNGFQFESVPDPRLAENRDRRSGRGIAMARTIMDEFSVENNTPHGTLVRMVKQLKNAAS